MGGVLFPLLGTEIGKQALEPEQFRKKNGQKVEFNWKERKRKVRSAEERVHGKGRNQIKEEMFRIAQEAEKSRLQWDVDA